MAEYSFQDIFADIGKVVKVEQNLDAAVQLMEAREVELTDRFDDDVYDTTYLESVLTLVNAIESSLNGNRTSVSNKVSEYVTGILRRKINSAYTSADDVILHLIDRMEQASGYENDEAIEGNLVSILPDYSESGDGSLQLDGYDGLRGLTSDNMDANSRVYFRVVSGGGGSAVVNIYKDSGLGSENLIGHTAAYTTAGSVDVIPDNSSGLRGTLTVVVVPGVTDTITVEWSFLGIRTGTGAISAWEASQMARSDDVIIKCTNADTVGLEQWRVRTREQGIIGGVSGLITTGVAFPASGVQDKTGLVVTITVGAVDFQVDDVFELKTASDDDAIFQTFFRRYFTRPLPFKLDGTETIADSLAE